MELKKVFLVSLSLGGLAVAGLNFLKQKADKFTEERISTLSLIAGDDPSELEILLEAEKNKPEQKEIDPHTECEKLYVQAFKIINNARDRYSCDLIDKYPNSDTSWLVRARKMKPFLDGAEWHIRNHYESYAISGVVNLSEADIDKSAEVILRKYWSLKYPESNRFKDAATVQAR